MGENLYTVQKTYEALSETIDEKDEYRIFKTEYERQMHCAGLTKASIKSAIEWLNAPGNGGVADHGKMLALLSSKLDKLVNIQKETRKELKTNKFVIDALIPKGETEVGTAIVSDSPEAQSKRPELHISTDRQYNVLDENGKLWSGNIDEKSPLSLGDGTYFGSVKDGKFEGRGTLKSTSGKISSGIWKQDRLYTGTVTDNGKEIDRWLDGVQDISYQPLRIQEVISIIPKETKKIKPKNRKRPQESVEPKIDFKSETSDVEAILNERKPGSEIIGDKYNFYKGLPNNPEFAQLSRTNGIVQIWGKKANHSRPVYFLEHGNVIASAMVNTDNITSHLKGIDQDAAAKITFQPPINQTITQRVGR